MTGKLKMRTVKTLFFFLIVSWGGWAARVWAQAADEDHKPTIHGIATGMTAQDVLDHLGGRMPDGRKEEKGSTTLTWKLEDGNILLVTFRGENIAELRLLYKKPRPTTDLKLVPIRSNEFDNPSTVSGHSPFDANPEWRRDYKVTETEDKYRNVWTRREKTKEGYEVEITFLSSSRKQLGDRFWEYIEYKYVSVPKDELKKFDEAVRTTPKK